MFQVNLGEKVLYYPASEDAAIYDTKLQEDIGQAGTLSFKVPPSNPLYSELTMGALVTIYKNGIEFWRGEIKEINTDFANIAEVYCVEDLIWLADEFLVPASITNETNVQRFQAAIAAYNLNRPAERQFLAGVVTNSQVSSLCNWVTEYDWSILDDLRECICKDNGYLRIRRVTSGGTVSRYVDIVRLEDYGTQATQPIEYGYNLLDYVKESDYGNLTNVLTPYGAETDTELYDGYNQRVQGTTIESQSSINVYGRHAKAVIFDDVEDLTDLNALASAYLTRYSQPQLTMEVKAVDLAEVENVDDIKIGDSVRIIAEPFAVDQWLYLTSISRDIQNIDKNSITMSGHVQTDRTLTEQAHGTAEAVKALPSRSSILDAAKKNAIEILDGTNGGNIYFVFNDDGQIIEQGFTNNTDLTQATAISRWNINGKAILTRNSPSDPWTVKVAETIDGGIVADFITSGTMSCDRLNGGTINGQTINGGTVTGSTIKSYRNGSTANGYVEISGGDLLVESDSNNFFEVRDKNDHDVYVTLGPEITVNWGTNPGERVQRDIKYLGYAVEDAYQKRH